MNSRYYLTFKSTFKLKNQRNCLPKSRQKSKLYKKSGKQPRLFSSYPTRNVKTKPLSTMTDCKVQLENAMSRGPQSSADRKRRLNPANHLHKGGHFTRLRTNTSAWRLTSPDAAVVTSLHHVNCQAKFLYLMRISFMYVNVYFDHSLALKNTVLRQ